jgi:hypothetical protein
LIPSANPRRSQTEKRLNELTPEPRFVSVQAIERTIVQVRQTLEAVSQIPCWAGLGVMTPEGDIACHVRTIVALSIFVFFALDSRKYRFEG